MGYQAGFTGFSSASMQPYHADLAVLYPVGKHGAFLIGAIAMNLYHRNQPQTGPVFRQALSQQKAALKAAFFITTILPVSGRSFITALAQLKQSPALLIVAAT